MARRPSIDQDFDLQGGFDLKDIVWIAVDWGTSNLRIWGVATNGELVAEASSNKGMAKLDRAGFDQHCSN
jgi:2-keto-3-deoxy-galactonokinase